MIFKLQGPHEPRHQGAMTQNNTSLRLDETGWGNFIEEAPKSKLFYQDRIPEPPRDSKIGTVPNDNHIRPNDNSGDELGWRGGFGGDNPANEREIPTPNDSESVSGYGTVSQQASSDPSQNDLNTPQGFEPQVPVYPRVLPWQKGKKPRDGHGTSSKGPSHRREPSQSRSAASDRSSTQKKGSTPRLNTGIDPGLFPSSTSIVNVSSKERDCRQDGHERPSREGQQGRDESSLNNTWGNNNDNNQMSMNPNSDNGKEDFDRDPRILEIPKDGAGYVKTLPEKKPFQRAPPREEPSSRQYNRDLVYEPIHRDIALGWDVEEHDDDRGQDKLGPDVALHDAFSWKQENWPQQQEATPSESSEGHRDVQRSTNLQTKNINYATMYDARQQDARFLLGSSNPRQQNWEPVPPTSFPCLTRKNDRQPTPKGKEAINQSNELGLDQAQREQPNGRADLSKPNNQATISNNELSWGMTERDVTTEGPAQGTTGKNMVRCPFCKCEFEIP